MRPTAIFLLLTFLLSACGTSTASPTPTVPAYNPFIPLDGSTTVNIPPPSNETLLPGQPTPTEMPFVVPTAIPLEQLLPTPRPAGMPVYTPTPDGYRVLPTLHADTDQYVVQPGDTLGSIAQSYGVSLEALMQANGLSDANLLEVGQILIIPSAQASATSVPFKIIPDSELVYGPASAQFNIEEFIREHNGYLAGFSQDVDGQMMTAAQIIKMVAQNYSVNPRLLLALIEYRSGWVNNAVPFQTDYALGLADPSRPGLYKQLTYAANELNRGYYLWRANALSAWVLADGSVVPIDGGLNAGTVAVQNLFAKLDDLPIWQTDVTAYGLFQTYFFLFGSPFDLAVDPVVPGWLHQPRLILPFERGVTWAFTGGPHGAWADGSAWAALDFAPIGDSLGCFQSEAWVTALTDGLITRTGSGQVIQDLDGDGYEQTGWVIFYMHVETRDRVQPGTRIRGGQRIGHASCEGGISNGTHVHIARKYNGEWIPAAGNLPFVMDYWTPTSAGAEYDGYLQRGDVTLEALEGITDANKISR